MANTGKMLLAGALLLAPLSVAQAATLVYENQIPYQFTEINTGPLTLGGFDSSLGTLNSVLVEYYLAIDSSAYVENNSATASNVIFRADYLGTFSFTGPAAIAGDYDISFSTGDIFSANVPANGGHVDLGPWSFSDSGSLSPLDVSQFIDNNIGYELNTLVGSSTIGGGGHAGMGMTTHGEGYARVTYDYTPVPEPAAWALMVAGFGLAGASLRRRRGSRARITA